MILGLIGGFASFFLFENFIGGIFFDTEKILLTPYFELNNILSAFILGTIMNGIAIIPKIIQAQKLKYGDIATSLDQDDLEAIYDEKLFLPKRKRDSGEILKTNGVNELNNKHNNTRRKIFKQKDEYEDSENTKMKFLTYLPYCLIGIGLIPLIFNIIIILRYSFSASDIQIDIVSKITTSLQEFQFATLFGLAFLVAGIIRLIVFQKPAFFAKISRRISKIFLKKYDHIIGLELIRQKKWSYIITYLAIFTSLLLTTNISFNSQYRYETLEETMYIGSDFRVQMNSHEFTNFSEILLFENEILNYKENNISQIDDVFTCFVDSNCTSLNEFSDILVESTFQAIFFNTEEYLDILAESEKTPPFPGFSNDLLRLIPDQNSLQNGISESIVSSEFLIQTNTSIGDKIEIHHMINNHNLEEPISLSIQIKIIGILDLVPGLYSESNSNGSSILIDLKNLGSNTDMIHGDKIIQLISFKDKADIDIPSFSAKFLKFGTSVIFNEYNQSWNDISKAPITIIYGTSGFFGLEYLNFTLLGFLLTVELSLTIILIDRENSHYNGLLLARGIGKKTIFKMELIKVFIVFLFSFVIGSIIGLGYSWIIVKAGQTIIKNSPGSIFPKNTNLPIYCDIGSLLTIFGLLIITSILILIINDQIAKNEEIEKKIKK